MDHNRRGLALMVSALLLSVLVASVRSCNDRSAETMARLETTKKDLSARIYKVTSPIRDYRIRSVEYGVMTVDAGPSLSAADLKTLASTLTRTLHDTEHEVLHSDLVMVDIYRDGKIACQAQTSARGIWVKLRE